MSKINELVQNGNSPISVEYPDFIPYFSKEGTTDIEIKVARLFDATPEQTSNGTAAWDKFGWSRDGWVF